MSQPDFGEFFKRTYSRVLAVLIMAARHRADAEDAAQEGYERAYRDWEKICAYDAPEAYVVKVAIQRLVKSRHRQVREGQSWLNVTVPPTATTEETVEASNVLSELAALSPDVRTAIVVCSVIGWKQQELADLIGVPRSAIAGWIFRGKATLRKKLDMPVPVVGPGEPLLPAPRSVAFPALTDEDPITAALIRAERWLRAGIEAEPETADRILARISAPELGPQGEQRQGTWRQALRKVPARTRGTLAGTIRRGKNRAAVDAERSPR
jgi:RNA polymerase sigma-70 factor (ECF subfamily)